MKKDNVTAELPGLPQAKKRGRPATGLAIPPAERMRRLRDGRRRSVLDAQEAFSAVADAEFLALASSSFQAVLSRSECDRAAVARFYIELGRRLGIALL